MSQSYRCLIIPPCDCEMRNFVRRSKARLPRGTRCTLLRVYATPERIFFQPKQRSSLPHTALVVLRGSIASVICVINVVLNFWTYFKSSLSDSQNESSFVMREARLNTFEHSDFGERIEKSSKFKGLKLCVPNWP